MGIRRQFSREFKLAVEAPAERRGAVAWPEHIQSHSVSGNLVKFMTSRQANLQEDTYFRVMRILQENPDFTQRELAEKLGISLGGVNYCLNALMKKGFLKTKNFAASKNKFGYIYALTASGVAAKAALTHRFLQRKMDEYEALRAEIEALRSEVEESSGKKVKKA
jgi:EPS-associated MarR family transcriptional regulator